ncbi:MaoC family dehydratase N-terminal domain-containing protein [Sphingopyxis sp.]|uniref:MaoC family dehydratase N-terminal domain-containing protein n=1 Tax=Sphingopyxis sp. TaxID=1908224 RepID=UPI0025D2D37F|nr:MaoC family dehydratase N-terminal domain-containing protein [Sphingopyxis sp.]MBK6411610.1 MaoC family dehydratase N-terminal domain-containing protein [Sphingopyxis sp.]
MIDKSWIGYEIGHSTIEIERGRLLAFARAIGEVDPVYTDVGAAQAAGYADLPVPPTFLFAAEMDSDTTGAMLDAMGIPLARLLHGEQGFIYQRPVCAGETITVTSRVTDVYDKKGGALEFVEKVSEARNAAGELVAELRAVLVVRN